MCRWRQISDTYAGCGHAYRLEDEIVHCQDHLCKFSPYHDPNCGPNCKETCWQYRQFPEQINRRLDRKCGPCVEAERRAAQAAYEAQQAAQGGRR
ncbi:hypothetical protein HYPSUDRAFT_49498 [Hypholoma sublateritium FD-334 SS-4]|uniref:Uncharacterized protein n=1 Tax=Hypholoma sublateritium (strain FD-334 SS-4) TaxID=945553 RepID=A0A0D2KH87_HYPSF|nr:hypothetical protein HYPSUDRAFT_49498 [Hypholoma sublateritium FD-334 SS-4]